LPLTPIGVVLDQNKISNQEIFIITKQFCMEQNCILKIYKSLDLAIEEIQSDIESSLNDGDSIQSSQIDYFDQHTETIFIQRDFIYGLTVYKWITYKIHKHVLLN
jgi:hypothetical protein